MNTELLEQIYTSIKGAVSGTTSHVYYFDLPSDELLNEVTVTYEVNNTSNVSTFEGEALKIFALEIKINVPSNNQLSILDQLSIYIKQSVDCLSVNHIRLNNEDRFKDTELNIYTMFLQYELQY
ncbi:MAG TPA: hypothetical protein VD927_11285 [Chryseosolibacter sp.]|nr:hypothetical protein [Chryseosolibacter sp.]